MNDETVAHDDKSGDQIWGAPQQHPRRWSLRTTLVAAGVAVLLAAGGGGAIYAATGNTANTGRGGMHGFGGPSGFGRSAGAQESALHGEFVVAGRPGHYVTELTQTGTVTAVSATSLTVRSEDGYQRSYPADATVRVNDGQGTLADIHQGGTVLVTADSTGRLTAVSTEVGMNGGVGTGGVQGQSAPQGQSGRQQPGQGRPGQSQPGQR